MSLPGNVWNILLEYSYIYILLLLSCNCQSNKYIQFEVEYDKKNPPDIFDCNQQFKVDITNANVYFLNSKTELSRITVPCYCYLHNQNWNREALNSLIIQLRRYGNGLWPELRRFTSLAWGPGTHKVPTFNFLITGTTPQFVFYIGADGRNFTDTQYLGLTLLNITDTSVFMTCKNVNFDPFPESVVPNSSTTSVLTTTPTRVTTTSTPSTTTTLSTTTTTTTIPTSKITTSEKLNTPLYTIFDSFSTDNRFKDITTQGRNINTSTSSPILIPSLTKEPPTDNVAIIAASLSIIVILLIIGIIILVVIIIRHRRNPDTPQPLQGQEGPLRPSGNVEENLSISGEYNEIPEDDNDMYAEIEDLDQPPDEYMAANNQNVGQDVVLEDGGYLLTNSSINSGPPIAARNTQTKSEEMYLTIIDNDSEHHDNHMSNSNKITKDKTKETYFTPIANELERRDTYLSPKSSNSNQYGNNHDNKRDTYLKPTSSKDDDDYLTPRTGVNKKNSSENDDYFTPRMGIKKTNSSESDDYLARRTGINKKNSSENKDYLTPRTDINKKNSSENGDYFTTGTKKDSKNSSQIDECLTPSDHKQEDSNELTTKRHKNDTYSEPRQGGKDDEKYKSLSKDSYVKDKEQAYTPLYLHVQ